MATTTTTFGTNLRRLRTKALLSQEGLARLAGLSVRAVCQLENGHTAPSRKSLFRLTNALKCELDNLYREGTKK
jgi:transcriptional regulator with XRE-family HTH domain